MFLNVAWFDTMKATHGCHMERRERNPNRAGIAAVPLEARVIHPQTHHGLAQIEPQDRDACVNFPNGVLNLSRKPSVMLGTDAGLGSSVRRGSEFFANPGTGVGLK
jgi:hypothetical protein